MKRFLPLVFACFGLTNLATAQLPDGSTAPDWTMDDINMVQHNLYSYLNAGKAVFLDFSATWCGPCWNYHNTHAIRDVYNAHSNDVMAFMIEGDNSTNLACLYGPAGCVGGTQGNWVSGTTYPIINNHTQNGPYSIAYYPTIYGICPDKKIYEVGQVGAAQLWEFAQGCSAPSLALGGITHVDCHGNSTGAITIIVTGGTPPFTYAWSNGANTQNISNIAAGNYSMTVTSTSGATRSIGPITVSQPLTELDANIDFIEPQGCNGLLGSIGVSAFGGTAGYSFLWSNGATSSVNTNLVAGTYSVSITDANSCFLTIGNLTVQPPTYPQAQANNNTLLTCTTPSTTLDGGGSSIGSQYVYNWTTSNGNIVSGANTLFNCVVNAAGNYQLLVTDASNNCSSVADTDVFANQNAPVVSAGPPGNLTCSASQTTLIGIGPSGPGYNILWTTMGGNIVSGANTLSPVVNAAGTYTLTITNVSNGCTGTSITSVTSNIATPNITASAGQITCANSNAALSGGSSTPGVTYLWTGPNNFNAPQQNTTTTLQGTYVLQVTNPVNGCTATSSVSVVQNTTAPNAAAQGGAITCVASAVTLSGNSSTPGVTYAWTGPNNYTSNQQNPVVGTAGNYLLTVTGTNGCTQIATAIVTQNTTLPTANAGPNGVLNCNANQVVLNGTGSSSGSQFVYLWTTTNGHIAAGATTLTPTVDDDGNYSLLVTNNNNGCTSTASTAVIQRQPVTAAITVQTNVLCNGNASGAATAAGGGGSGTFTYAWSTGANTAAVSNLGAGSYTVIVTDSEGCNKTESVTITQPSLLSVNAATTAQSIPGVNNGSATANPQGGTGNYSYLWSNGMTTSTIVDLAPGNYSVVVTDANGCQKSQTVTVNVFGCAVSASTFAQDVSCNGSTDGAAGITLTNAALPQAFLWSNGGQTSTIGNLAPGNYSVSATDGNGCEVVASVEVDQPGILNANSTSTALTAAGAMDGTATANPTGGTGPFTFAWSNGSTTKTITGLPSANYTVSVTDANGCVAIQTIPVAPFGCSTAANITSTNISCFGQIDGQATVTLLGGLTPYTYAWSNGASTATISNLPAGTYTVSVNDAVNCPAISEVTILEPTNLEIEAVQIVDTDCGVANGSATISATGGSGPPTYSLVWSNGQSGPMATNLSAGSYSVSVSDLNGCHAELSVEVGINDDEAPTVATHNLTLPLNANGIASLTASEVDNGSADNCTIANMTLDQGSFTCSDLGLHQVTLTVFDGAGNSSTGTATVEIVDNLPPVAAVQNVAISLDENGVAIVTPEQLNNASSDNCGIVAQTIDISNFTCANIGQNAVVLTVRDASGNEATSTAIVTVQDNTAPSITCPDNMKLPYCQPVATFDIQASDNCAQAISVNQASGLPSGAAFPTGMTVQTFEAQDGHGNSSTCSFTVEVTVPLEAELTAEQVSCFGEMDGEIAANVTGGSEGYSYMWSTGATSSSIQGLGAGTYAVSVIDNDGCETVETTQITVPTVMQISPVLIVPETAGQQNGAIDVAIAGGTQPYTFEWTNASGNLISTEEDISNIAVGNYTLSVLDANGCTSLNVFTVQSVSTVAFQKLEKNISLFPNPASDAVTVAFEEIDALEADISLSDVTGKLVAQFKDVNVSAGLFTMEVSSHAAGFYLVRILIENQLVTKRLVLQK